MKRPAPISLPAKYFAVLLAITIGYLAVVTAMASGLDGPSALGVFAIVIAGMFMGWLLHEGFTEWRTHVKAELLRAQRAKAAEAAMGELAAALGGVTPEQMAAFRRRIGLPATAPETTEETRP